MDQEFKMMDVSAPSLEPCLHRVVCSHFSYKKCCLFLVLFITLIVLISGFLSLIIIFVLKPRRPVFSFQTMSIASYKFDVTERSSLLISSVAYMTFAAHNPNRVGIRYDFSRLDIVNNGLVIGMLRIPGFYQPPRSHNVSLKIDILFQSLDITTIMSGVKTNFTIKVLGDIGVHLQLLQIKLPKIKVGLDCDVAIDGRYLTSINEISNLKVVKNHIEHFDANSQSQAFSKKCSVGVYL